jgi:hypothetical protein
LSNAIGSGCGEASVTFPFTVTRPSTVPFFSARTRAGATAAGAEITGDDVGDSQPMTAQNSTHKTRVDREMRFM